MNSQGSLQSKFLDASPIVRYGAAILLTGAALWLSLVFEVSFGNPFWFFFPSAVIASTWFCGKGPGWLTTALSMVVVQYYFIPPLRSFEITTHDLPFSLTFLACQTFATWLVTKRRQSEQSLRQVNAALVEQMAERERAEESLRRARAQLSRVARATTVGEFAASVAHEINQPLGAIVANSDACVAWLAAEPPNLPEARTAAERAAKGATRASEVIRRIRSLVSNAPAERLAVQINQVISEIADLTTFQAAKSNVTIHLRLQPNLPAISGDRIQLQQVILNLITNGIEATSGVTGVRQLEIHSQAEATGEVQVSVSDTGVGVAPELMPRLFEPFFTTRTQGIGMGLSISRSIIESHGGRLTAESSLGRGSVFRFTLPRNGGSP
jgi:C4-dicarboxylate-specific signal transduction histidine kinase